MSIVDAALDAARERAQSLMDSTVRIRRNSGKERDPDTGLVVDTFTTIYEGPARVRDAGTQPRDVDQAGRRFVEQSPTVGLPIADDPRIVIGTSGDVQVDDVGEVIDNPDDSSIVGTEFRVAGRHDQSHSSSRRLPVEVFSHDG